MKHLTVGLFNDNDSLGRELGKKGTESDIVVFNRKMDDCIFTLMSPVEDKITAKSQIVSAIDAAIVLFSGMTRELGESIVLLNSVGVSTGIAISSPYATPEQVRSITKGTSLESFQVSEKDPVNVLQILKTLDPERDMASPVEIVVDHSFSVKGVGEVLLGFVKKGIVRKYDKLKLLPANKEVLVRSIQLQDEDCEEAPAGARVGLAVKGATVEEMSRGSILTATDKVKVATALQLHLDKSPFYSNDVNDGMLHVTVGMQTIPVTVKKREGDSIAIESEKPIGYAPEDVFLALDLNAKKNRVVGKCRS
jgi:selenocysteine-specific translation elongation factor